MCLCVYLSDPDSVVQLCKLILFITVTAIYILLPSAIFISPQLQQNDVVITASILLEYGSGISINQSQIALMGWKSINSDIWDYSPTIGL